MVYDCFTFFNELDLLEIRLNVLKDVVDRFVLVEAGETHAGRPKPMMFAENRARFATFADRIAYVAVERFPSVCTTDWARENWQRNAISKGLEGAQDGDAVLISDLDEIPRPEAVRANIGRKGVTAFDQTYYAYYLNYRNVRQQWWLGTRMVSYRDFLHAFDGVDVVRNEFLPPAVNEGTTASKIRCRVLPRARGGQRVVRNGGWHFTSLGGAQAVAQKIASFAHQEYNPGEGKIDLSEIERMIREGRGPFWQMRCFGERMDASYPDYVVSHADAYAHLVFPVTPAYLRANRLPRLVQTVRGKLTGMAECACPEALHNFLHRLKRRAAAS